ncbi:PA2169 family four-helix-bundle protein [Flavobacterium sp.]|uniref:ferritin-like domain-containing protein n=1 Tax=Flavobacterium sp. TaxID=239 RepID=UPI0026173CE9|nr:PA2169 family four-helix-bundle protein [Flavobacterium sp.]
METNKTIDALNNLVEINNDRVEGYETALKETDAADLKTLFKNLIGTSQNNLNALSEEVLRLGGEPTASTRITGKFFRAWMDVKAALTGNDRHQILASCEFGEDKALEAYEEALKDSSKFSTEQVTMVREQQTRLRADHDHVRSLRDAAA